MSDPTDVVTCDGCGTPVTGIDPTADDIAEVMCNDCSGSDAWKIARARRLAALREQARRPRVIREHETGR